MSERLWTLLEVLQWTGKRLAGTGTETPRLDAEILLAHALKLQRLDLYLQHDRPLQEGELERFKGLVRQRLAGTPVAYLTGRREFWNHSFRVDGRVMVPRPETELLVEQAVEAIPEKSEARVADVCTGSGAVLLSILAEREECTGVGLELSPEALVVARENAAELGLGERVEFCISDVLGAAEGRFDLITSNPPYVPDGDWEGLAADIRDHEPRLALTSGGDGLDVVRRLLEAAPGFLKPGGLFLMEYSGGEQTGPVLDLARSAGLQELAILKDLAGHDRVLRARNL